MKIKLKNKQLPPHKNTSSNADIAFISPNEVEVSESDKTFVEQFKQCRKQMGFSQTDVGIALGELYGNIYTSRTICKFENLRLTTSNLRKLKPILQMWLDKTESDQKMT